MLDANILIRAVLGTRVLGLLRKYAGRVEFMAPDFMFQEAREHLPGSTWRRLRTEKYNNPGVWQGTTPRAQTRIWRGWIAQLTLWEKFFVKTASLAVREYTTGETID
ncbi:PIN domain-containing protein [Paludibaculum fermentans]|uniref:PIN domain-containing protein n=1 Tax=Paludibaculum fermentans TaxID=1473598 RepID=UPI003EBAD28E